MNPQSTLEDRLARLEDEMTRARRSATRARTAAMVLGSALVAITGVAMTRPDGIADVIQARGFEVMDQNDRLVFRASATKAGGQIDIWTAQENGANVFRASANNHGGDLALWNRDGENTAWLLAGADGGELGLWNNQGSELLRVTGTEHGGRLSIGGVEGSSVFTAQAGARGGSVSIARPDGAPNVLLGGVGGEHEGGSIGVLNEQGSVVASFSAGQDGAGLLSVSNQRGVGALTASADQQGSGVFMLHDAAGSPRISAGSVDGSGIIEIANVDDQVVVRTGGDPALRSGFVRLNNAAGVSVLSAAVDDDACGRLDLAIDSGQTVFSVDASATKGSAIAMRNTSGKQMLLLGTSEKGGLLNIMNEAGNPVCIAGYSNRGRGGAISVRNGRGLQVMYAGADEDDRGVISTWDEEAGNERSLGADR